MDGLIKTGTDKLQKKPAPTAQVEELIATLPWTGKHAYEVFVQALVDTDNHDAADFLRQKEGRPAKPKVIHIEEPMDTEWPNLQKSVTIIQKKEINRTSDDDFEKILKCFKVYPITGKTKGKCIMISNVPDHDLVQRCEEQCESEYYRFEYSSSQSTVNFVEKARQHVDFDKTSMHQFFKYLKFEIKVVQGKTKEELWMELKEEVTKKENFDMLVVVFLSGGLGYEPGQIYDAKREKVPRNEVLNIIRKSEEFQGKPKVVIIDTYNFQDIQIPYDILDSDCNPNHDDMFVITSMPKPGIGPWMIGKDLKGSYFIQALLHVFKKQAHNQSFLELIDKVNKLLQKACVPSEGYETVTKDVGKMVVLEKSIDRGLFLFPGKTDETLQPETKYMFPKRINSSKPVQATPDVDATQAQVRNSSKNDWPDLEKGVMCVKKRDIIKASEETYKQIMNSKEEIYDMTKGRKKGKVIWIVNTMFPNTSSKIDADEDQRIEKCRNNIDFDKVNMDALLKYVGFDSRSKDHLRNKPAQEIKAFLKQRLEDNDTNVDYASLVVMILSGKSNCDAGTMYDKDGTEIVVEEEITKILCESEYFKGKPKINCVLFDSLDEKVDNDMVMLNDPNSEDLFVVSTYPRIEQGPWMIGENMVGSYFIQAFVHVFKNHAHDKSFLEILQKVQRHLVSVTVPVKDQKGEYTKRTTTEHVADVVVKQRGQKKLYFFPGYTP